MSQDGDRQADIKRRMDSTDQVIGDQEADPYRRAAGFEERAALWLELQQFATEEFAPACALAHLHDKRTAARIRFAHGIPTLFPATEAALLGLDRCEDCHRPWQAGSDGACPSCPTLHWGPTPRSREEAATLPSEPASPLDR